MLLLGKHCPDEKGLSFTLMSIFGVNAHTALKVCAMLGVRRNVTLRTVAKTGRDSKLSRLCRDYISTSTERRIKQDIKQLLHIKHYKGVRHMFALPCRGQRTRTNASTSRRHAIVKHLDPKRAKKSGSRRSNPDHRTKKNK